MTQEQEQEPMVPWAVYVAAIWLVAAAFAFLDLIPYATYTARRALLIYTVLLIVAILGSLFRRRRA